MRILSGCYYTVKALTPRLISDSKRFSIQTVRDLATPPLPLQASNAFLDTFCYNLYLQRRPVFLSVCLSVCQWYYIFINQNYYRLNQIKQSTIHYITMTTKKQKTEHSVCLPDNMDGHHKVHGHHRRRLA